MSLDAIILFVKVILLINELAWIAWQILASTVYESTEVNGIRDHLDLKNFSNHL